MHPDRQRKIRALFDEYIEMYAARDDRLTTRFSQNFSGYPGSLKEEAAKDLLKRRPEVIMERAVKGMLPKNRLGRKMYKKLFVYAGAEHPHTAQQPKELKF